MGMAIAKSIKLLQVEVTQQAQKYATDVFCEYMILSQCLTLMKGPTQTD